MKAEEIQAGQLFKGDQQLLIPLWQRHYSWDKPQLSELWSDLARLGVNDERTHFLGSIVLKKLPWSGMPSEARQYWVVGGQQRITTLTILLCAVRDRLADLEDSDAGRQQSIEQLNAQLLVNTNLIPAHQDRLVLQEQDRALLRPLVHATWSGEEHGRIERAYSFFRARLRDMSADDAKQVLTRVLTRLDAVWVTLESGDNAHRVFQTLNAGGKKLKQSDLVRNYFFLLLGERGDDFYSERWRRLEAELSESRLDEYFVAWTISQGYTGATDALFSYFHQDLQEQEHDLEAVLLYGHALTDAARIYQRIRQPLDGPYSSATKQTMLDLHNWGTRPVEGLILWLLRQHEAERLSEPQMRRALEIALSFMARRQLSGYEPNLHKSIFVATTRKLRSRTDLNDDDLVHYLHYLLSIGDDVRTWPSDVQVTASARGTQVYKSTRAQWTFTILERVNRQMFKSAKNAPPTLDRSKYSIEHVLPQTMTPQWQADLKSWGVENPMTLHDTHLHVLGNLTLTAINSELSNLPFDKKRHLLQDDWLRLNADVTGSQTWTENRINERSTALSRLACAAFASPLEAKALAEARERFGAAGLNTEIEGVQAELNQEGDVLSGE